MLYRLRHDARSRTLRSPTRRVILDTALAVLITVVIAGGARGSATLHHIPQQTTLAWTPIHVEWVVQGGLSLDEIASADVVIVSLSEGGSYSERTIPLVPDRERLRGDIPADAVRSPAVEYFLRILDMEGVESIFPSGAPEAGLYRTTVFDLSLGSDQGSQGSSVDTTVELLSPLPGEIVQTATPEIAGLFNPPLEGPWDALFLLDGEDLTGALELARDLFVVALPDSLGRGSHSATLVAFTPDRSVEASWVFSVYEQDETAPGVGGWTPTKEPPVAFGDRGGEGVLDFHGRVEVGWAAVLAETTAVDSLDVYLPYEETSAPSFNLYAASVGPGTSILVTAQSDPVYDEDVHWLVSIEGRRHRLEVGEIFPEFTSTTLEWASGVGIVGEIEHGPGLARAVAMRTSEADTIGGFGVYSRFALGMLESVKWREHSTITLSYLHTFDREASVEEEQRLVDPLRSHVLASEVRTEFGERGTVEIEIGRSETSGYSSSGDDQFGGTAVRAELGWAREHDSGALLRYVQSDADFYSAGSLRYDPGERGVELEYTWSVIGVKLSGSGGVFRSSDADRGIALDRSEMRFYSRADMIREIGEGSIRGYGVARYDLIPYDVYDYRYTYAAAGATYRISRVSASLSFSWSRTRSDDCTDSANAGGNIRLSVIPGKLSVRGSARWTTGESDDGETDYERVSYALVTKLTGGERDLRVEYRYLEKEDNAAPDQSYGEHVLRISLGASF